MDKGQIIKHLVATEKATIMIDDESKLQFIVDIRANKNEIKDAVEMVFETPVKNIRTMITFKGEKKAIIDLKEEGKAREIGTSLGIL
ncbi:MAG: 50S ribosomal protein L23 [Methanophagales archaeon]|jgi:large subunit ribosomal protein L23|nr:large subunit ribosomal protein L23 [Methanophagales archaeon]KAF5436689.1 large subunit ribosomal protein L23 [Methanophagales archaeon]MCK4731277.1 50S ribosomal protein L23 [Methanophagales archaeon]